MCRNLAATSYRFMFWAGSFHYLKYTGKQATRAEAPILVAASHSTFVDTIVIYFNGPPSCVAKAEAASFPFIGSMCYIFVWLLIFLVLSRINRLFLHD